MEVIDLHNESERGDLNSDTHSGLESNEYQNRDTKDTVRSSGNQKVNEGKAKRQVQINLEPTMLQPKKDVPAKPGVRMKGNVLIQNPLMEWKVRNCELNGSFLTFFRKQKMVAAIDLEQVGDIRVVRQIYDSVGKGAIFSLYLKEGRYFNVRVTQYEDAVNWVKVLVEVRDKLRSHVSHRSKSFSGILPVGNDFTPGAQDLSTSLVADEADDNIQCYFDNEQCPPSPILESNEKYIRPIGKKSDLPFQAVNADYSPLKGLHSSNQLKASGSDDNNPISMTRNNSSGSLDTTPRKIITPPKLEENGDVLDENSDSAGNAKKKPKSFAEIAREVDEEDLRKQQQQNDMEDWIEEDGAQERLAMEEKMAKDRAEALEKRIREREIAAKSYLAKQKQREQEEALAEQQRARERAERRAMHRSMVAAERKVQQTQSKQQRDGSGSGSGSAGSSSGSRKLNDSMGSWDGGSVGSLGSSSSRSAKVENSRSNSISSSGKNSPNRSAMGSLFGEVADDDANGAKRDDANGILPVAGMGENSVLSSGADTASISSSGRSGSQKFMEIVDHEGNPRDNMYGNRIPLRSSLKNAEATAATAAESRPSFRVSSSSSSATSSNTGTVAAATPGSSGKKSVLATASAAKRTETPYMSYSDTTSSRSEEMNPSPQSAQRAEMSRIPVPSSNQQGSGNRRASTTGSLSAGRDFGSGGASTSVYGSTTSSPNGNSRKSKSRTTAALTNMDSSTVLEEIKLNWIWLVTAAFVLFCAYYLGYRWSEQRWREESLRHLHAMSLSSRSADAVSNPLLALPSGALQADSSISAVGGGAATGDDDDSSSSSSALRFITVSLSRGDKTAIGFGDTFASPATGRSTTGGGRAPGMIGGATSMPATSTSSSAGGTVTTAFGGRYSNNPFSSVTANSKNSNVVVSRFLRDLVTAPGRFIVGIFSKIMSIFSKS